MNLDAAIETFAVHLNINAASMQTYANEDDLGGYHTDSQQRMFPVGSLWGVDGQALYALIRALKPQRILELGVRYGASTSHLRKAVAMNRTGSVLSVDIWAGAGEWIPDTLAGYGVLQFEDALTYIPMLPDNSIDFVFEDMMHEREQVKAVIELLRPKLTLNAVIVHHDSEHGDEGKSIKQGIADAGITDYASVLIEPSDCGLAAYRLVE